MQNRLRLIAAIRLTMKKRILKICGHTIQPGEHLSIRLPTPKLFTYTPVDIPIHIFNSKNRDQYYLFAPVFMGMKFRGLRSFAIC